MSNSQPSLGSILQNSGYDPFADLADTALSTTPKAEDQIPTEDAWALVAMADRINRGRYVKYVEYVSDGQGRQSGEIAYWPNRELIASSLKTGNPAVIDEDRIFGQCLAEHYQQLIFTVLGTNSYEHDFDHKLFNIIQQPTVGRRTGIAFMASLGARYHREIAREKVDDLEQKIGVTSMWQGEVDEHIQRTVYVIARFPGKTFMGSVVRATDGENLYFWTSSRPVDHWDLQRKMQISAIIKSHGISSNNNYKQTRLTRVKRLGYLT